jgi:hypothetical protein
MVGLFLFAEKSSYLRYSRSRGMRNSISPKGIVAYMSLCPYCRRELPGLETLCQQCFEAEYDRQAHPKPWWQRFHMRPQFTRDNFIGFFLLFTFAFASFRFDFPYFHARHMRTTESSTLISTLIACIAFFRQGKDKLRPVVAPFGNARGKIDWHQFVLLAGVEVAAGFLLYLLCTFLPRGAQFPLGVTSFVILQMDILIPSRRRSLGSLLCAITAVPATICGIAWSMADQAVWLRLALVNGCLMAGLILLDRWEELG